MICHELSSAASASHPQPHSPFALQVVQWLLTSYGDKITLTPPSYAKPTYLNMMDKNECPSVSHSYILTTAFACILDTIKCVSSLVKGPTPDSPVFESSSPTEPSPRNPADPAIPTATELKLIVTGVAGPALNVLNALLEVSRDKRDRH